MNHFWTIKMVCNYSPAGAFGILAGRDDAINLLLSSIAMEELGLSHILNAEGEKIQYILGTLPGVSSPISTISDVLLINSSVRDTIREVTKK
ncbi:hypothetical protein [Paenibacillus sp. L3-i20]|uniref:hypothetical protein n=1 Tax=Paenibacillus sp. L3-i20 TaxID=2905833 RepID=UPI002852D50C|nr:hypothetical protein [Paenibacillus sp. L3-i20]